MAFLLYEQKSLNGEGVLTPTGKTYSLAGYNLIHKAWIQNGRPINQGWDVSATELVKLLRENDQDFESWRLLIDWVPNSKTEVGVIELLHVYAYTFGSNGDAEFTPMMWKLRNVLNCHVDSEPDAVARKQCLPVPRRDDIDFVEFLYLKGKKEGWNWGKMGMTNACFIEGAARAYFKQYF